MTPSDHSPIDDIGHIEGQVQKDEPTLEEMNLDDSELIDDVPLIDDLAVPLVDDILLDSSSGHLPPLSSFDDPNNDLRLNSIEPEAGISYRKYSKQPKDRELGADDEDDVLLSMPPPPPPQQAIPVQNVSSQMHASESSQANKKGDLKRPGTGPGSVGADSVPSGVPGPQYPLEAPPMERSGASQPIPADDPLTVAQLQNLAKQLKETDNVPYAFEYTDAASFPEEIEEWFHYASEEFQILNMAANVFTLHWMHFTGEPIPDDGVVHKLEIGWITSSEEMRARFVVKLSARVDSGDETLRPDPPSGMDDDNRVDESLDGLTMHDALFALVYIMLGCWQETAGLTPDEDLAYSPPLVPPFGADTGQSFHQRGENVWQSKYGKSITHFEWIKSNTRLVLEHGGLEAIMKVVCPALDNGCGAFIPELSEERSQLRRKIWCSLTLMYIILEVVRVEEDASVKARNRDQIISLEPNLVTTLMATIDSFRWKDFVDLPKAKIFLLTWKAILASLGGLPDVTEVKKQFRDPLLDESDQRGHPVITASPLDYHQFRQEIGSKYPTYVPPPSIFPLAPDHRTILPPLNAPTQSKFTAGSSDQFANHNGVSIMHQAVHIATPAPSPPPSPGPSGKGFKKQNYQTNQLFPLLYPMSEGKDLEFPHRLEGVDNSELEREWKGDVPLSILEGTQLFVKRLYAPRAMNQLWEERETFMKFQRGWVGAEHCLEKKKKATTSLWGSSIGSAAGLGRSIDALEELELGESLHEARKVKTSDECDNSGDGKEQDQGDEAEAEESDPRLAMIERLYQENLPRWQSIVIVLLNVLHANANTAFMPTTPPLNNLSGGGPPATGNRLDGIELNQQTIDAVDAIRSQEISTKAVSGILILLLKWFRVSHVLKFEYITQLLLDSNFLPLVLRIFYTQNIERLMRERFELKEFNFFSFCRRSSSPSAPPMERHDHQATQQRRPSSVAESDIDNSAAIADDDEFDDACPPPIKLRRCDPVQDVGHNRGVYDGRPGKPDPEPITVYSWRSFFIFINFLRIMQKVCKKKAHRELLMVTYKSSQFLGKTLRIQQRDMQLYTLKLFKSQVPFCGRKWRQANMNVITAVYLHCRPELREEWLAGMDVDAEVAHAVPNEQALRALTHWHNVRRYPREMGIPVGKAGSRLERGCDSTDRKDGGKRSGGKQSSSLRIGPSVLSLEDEQDFFTRELEKMRWEAGGEGVAFQEHQRWAESVEELV